MSVTLKKWGKMTPKSMFLLRKNVLENLWKIENILQISRANFGPKTAKNTLKSAKKGQKQAKMSDLGPFLDKNHSKMGILGPF